MTVLGAAIAARRGESLPLVVTPGGSVEAAALAGLVPAGPLAGARRVALCLRDTAALLRVLAGLDGHAEALLLVSPALPPEAVAALAAEAGADALVSDRTDLADAVPPGEAVAPGTPAAPARTTDWVLTTSGTTGLPKMVRHRLAGLARSVKPAAPGTRPLWGLLYEPTRFAGLQVVLQALLGGGRLAAPAFDAPVAERLAFLADAGASHLSATPTLWRRVLMERAGALAPTHVTLGGEIADQPVLDALGRRFPQARIRHIYAATETGVGFSVRDGRAGFPAAWLDAPQEGVGLAIREGRLWLCPPEAPRALGTGAVPADGFLDTGDRVRLDGDRVLFLGRESAAVNIGGAKIQPEEVERVICEHPGVALARVGHRPSPITGALLTLAVVPADPGADPAALRRALRAFCRERLPREAMPASIAVEPDLALNAAGKIVRGAA